MKKGILFILAVLAWLSVSFWYIEKDRDRIMPLNQSWEKAVPHQETPNGLVSLRAEDCGVCHKDHYEEWKISTHAHAWTDMQFQAELKKGSSPFLCINCHIPLQNQQEFEIKGLFDGDIYKPVKKANPHFDPKLKLEGITCASCHVRDGAIVGKIGSELAPHPVKKDIKLLSEELCISCHNANAVVTPELACTFETGDEWKAGPYFPEKNCISCHMETIERPLVAGYPNRNSHRHWFPGSGIPKVKGEPSKGLNGMAFYPQPVKNTIKKGQAFKFELVLENKEAGHRLPSGDPERFYLINLFGISSKGDTIKQANYRIGEKWEWYPEAKKLSDNNLYPKEKRSFGLEFTAEESFRLIAQVTKHRMDEATARYNQLGDHYPLQIQVFEEYWEIIVK